MPITARKDGYSRLSIAVHWLAAAIIITLFITQEGDRGTTAYAIHVGGGAIAGIFLLWRVWHRFRLGMTETSDQAYLLNLASQMVIWGFLAAIVVVVVTVAGPAAQQAPRRGRCRDGAVRRSPRRRCAACRRPPSAVAG